jgi:hypothetical protein
MTAPLAFPNPAVLEVSGPVLTDDVTETIEELTKRIPVAGIAAGLAASGGGWSVGWDDEDRINGVILASVEDQGDWIVGASTEGQTFRFRDLDPHDAIWMAPNAGVPQPLQAVQAHVIRGGVLADSLDALVAADNTVATLMLETGMGTFVRYSGDWQLLSDDTGALEDLAVVAVAPGAVSVWDAADSAATTLSIFDLPRPGDDGSVLQPEPVVDVETTAAIAASGVSIPQVCCVEDLDLGIRYANAHPEARWYVTKRARALAASGRIPTHWNVAPVAVTPPFTASQEGTAM